MRSRISFRFFITLRLVEVTLIVEFKQNRHMEKIDEKEALLSIETYKEILEKMDEEERQRAILDEKN